MRSGLIQARIDIRRKLHSFTADKLGISSYVFADEVADLTEAFWKALFEETCAKEKKSEPTVTLNDGTEVLAQIIDGAIFAVTYANRTQARKRLSTMPPGWFIHQPNRVFYVAKQGT